MSHSNKVRRLLCGALLLSAVATNALAASPVSAKLEPFDAFIEKLAADWVHADPIGATDSQYFSGPEQDALDRKLNAKDFQYGTPPDRAERLRRGETARAAHLETPRHAPRIRLDLALVSNRIA